MQPQPYEYSQNVAPIPTTQYPQVNYVPNQENPGFIPMQNPQYPQYEQSQPYYGPSNPQPAIIPQYNNPIPQPAVIPQYNNPIPQPAVIPQYDNTTYTNPPQQMMVNNTTPQMGVIFADQEQAQQDQYKPYNNSITKSTADSKPLKLNHKLSLKRTISSLADIQNPGPVLSLIAFTSIIVILALMIGLMAYHFVDKELKLTSVSGGLEYIVSNLNSDPILELSTSNSIYSCPLGTEAIHLGRWEGTIKGCNCAVTGVLARTCESDELLCDNINNISPIDMYKWEGSVLCAKRAQPEVDYVKASTCPLGYRPCSAGICLANSKSCPITSVTLTTTVNANLRLGSSSQYLALARANGDSPVIDFEISINDLPCFSSTEIPSGKGSYTLLNKKPLGCGKYGSDSGYSYEIDRMTNEEVFQYNNFPSSVFGLPKYQSVLQSTPTLFSGRKRITVANNDECLALDTDRITKASNAAGSLNRFMTGSAITAMVLHSILFILTLSVLPFMKKEESWREIFLSKNLKQWMPGYLYLGFAEVIVFIVMVGLVGGANTDMNNAKNYLNELDEMGCFLTGAPQQVIADYDEVVDEVASTLNGLAVALLVISLVSYVPVAVRIFQKRFLKQRNNKRTFTS